MKSTTAAMKHVSEEPFESEIQEQKLWLQTFIRCALSFALCSITLKSHRSLLIFCFFMQFCKRWKHY